MRERRFISFDTSNQRHQKALSLFDSQPKKCRGKFVIECILQVQQQSDILEVVRETITKMLSDKVFAAEPKNETQISTEIADIPNSLLTALDDF